MNELWYKTQKNGYWVTHIPVVIAMGMMVLQSQWTNNRNAVNRGCDILLNLACRCLYKLPDNVNVSLASSVKCSVLWFCFFILGTADCWNSFSLADASTRFGTQVLQNLLSQKDAFYIGYQMVLNGIWTIFWFNYLMLMVYTSKYVFLSRRNPQEILYFL